MHFKIGLTLLMCFLFVGSYAQEPLKEKSWKRLSRNLDYSKQESSAQTKKESEEANYNSDRKKTQLRKKTPSVTNTQFGSTLAIILGVILLVLIIFLLANSKANPKINNSLPDIEFVENIEEQIHDVNIDSMLQQAIGGEQYNLAIRLSFLAIIKTLSEQGYINWAKQKTNWEYYYELSASNFQTEYHNTVLDFERVWYGERVLNQTEFEEIHSRFERFNQEIKGHVEA